VKVIVLVLAALVGVATSLFGQGVADSQSTAPSAHRAHRVRGEAIGLDNRPLTVSGRSVLGARAVPATPASGGNPAAPATPAVPSNRPADPGHSDIHRP